jgi:ABC-type glutathione transport system ATPase component
VGVDPAGIAILVVLSLNILDWVRDASIRSCARSSDARRGRSPPMSDALLEVRDLRTYIYTRRGVVKAVDGASFAVQRGETLGIVGESGSGKSMTCLSILRLVPEPGGRIVGGQILFDGEDLLAKSREEMRELQGSRIAHDPADPMASLNPA